VKDTDQKDSTEFYSSESHSDRRSNSGFWIALIIGIALFGGLLWYVTPAELWRLIQQVDFTFVVLALTVKLGGTVIRTLQFGLFSDISGRFLSTYGIFSLTRLLTIALPFRAGEVILLTLLKRAKLSPTIAGTIPIWVVLRVCDLIALAALFSLFIGLSDVAKEYSSVGYLALGGAALALALLHIGPRFLPVDYEFPGNRWVSGRLNALVDGLRHIQSGYRKMASVGLAVLIWASLIGMAVAAQLAMMSPFSLWDCALIAAFVLSIAILPINAPLGLGTGETIWATILVIFGLPLQEAVTLALGIRIVILSISCLEGAIGFIIVWRLGIWPAYRSQHHKDLAAS
jgi:hypothetical protein